MCPFNFYHNSRFRKPPCNPGRSDFPNPVLVSAPQVIFQIKAFLYNPRLKCQLTYTQNHTVYQYPRSKRQVQFSSSVPGCTYLTRNHRVPRVPLPNVGVTLHWGDFKIASEDITLPSQLVRTHAPNRFPLSVLVYPCTLSLRRLSLVPAGKRFFPTLSLQSLRRRLDPYSVVFPGCIYSFLPRELRPHAKGNAFGTPKLSLQCNFHREPYFEAAVIRLPSGSYAR